MKPISPQESYAAQIEREQCRSFLRACAAVALSEPTKQNPVLLAQRAWPDDSAARMMLRAAAPPLSSADATALKVDTLGLFLNLMPASATLRLFRSQMQVTLGRESSVRIPSIATPPVAVFVPELGPVPVVQAMLNSTTLGSVKKIELIAVISEELQRGSPQSATEVIGSILEGSVAKSIDATAFDSNVGDDVRPPGLLYGIAPIAASTATGVEAIAADLAALASAMAAANIDPEDFVIVAGQRAATKARVLVGPRFTNEIFLTTGLPEKTVVGFARGAVASSFDGAPAIELKRDATLHLADPASPLLAAPTESLFQHFLVALKLRQWSTWAVTAPGGVQRIDNVAW
jgi:hypothetical protein